MRAKNRRCTSGEDEMLGRHVSQCAAHWRYVAKGREDYHWTMSRIHPECADSEPPDRSVAADVLLRQEPDEEEDEEEDEGDRKEDDEDEDTDDGYSE
jgi:hypothetical protein